MVGPIVNLICLTLDLSQAATTVDALGVWEREEDRMRGQEGEVGQRDSAERRWWRSELGGARWKELSTTKEVKATWEQERGREGNAG